MNAYETLLEAEGRQQAASAASRTNLIDAVESMQKRLDRLETIVERSSGAGI